ncbi:hypothetical protein C8J57DRAFT_1565256 [Mycena rebaudengoi]|nr:hypothetical protein C8J57DRAFT_1565256 [Mycena rebaudengoi]
MIMLTDPYISLCEELSAGSVLDLRTYISDPSFSGMFNPDMMGFGVRLAGILIAWGIKTNSDAALTALLVQMGSQVLCTHSSIIRGQLTFIDCFFVLTIVHSPIAWYIIWTNLPHLYYWIHGHKKMQNWNSALVVVLLSGWISLHALLWIKGWKFPGENCGSMSAKTYLSFLVLPGVLPSTSPIVFVFPPLVHYHLYIIHHWKRKFSVGEEKRLVVTLPTVFATLRMLLNSNTPHLGLDLLLFVGDPERLPAGIKSTKFAPSHPLSCPPGSTREDSTPISADTVSPNSRLGLEVERDDPLDITVEHAKSLADDHDPFESTRLPSCLGWITPISESPSSNVDIFFPRSASPVEMHALRGATPPPQRQPDHGQPDSYSNIAVSNSESNEGSGQPSSDLGTTARSSSISTIERFHG